MGNPHAIYFTNNVDEINIEDIGEKIENYKYFPNKTNVEFVQIINKGNIKMRVWERGVGETLGCGTGACAAGIVSYWKKSTNRDVIVDLPGGKLKIVYFEKEKVYELRLAHTLLCYYLSLCRKTEAISTLYTISISRSFPVTL